MGKDYYGVLGVDKGADEATLKKGNTPTCSFKFRALLLSHNSSTVFNQCVPCAAYRTKAMKWHPVRPRELWCGLTAHGAL